MWRRARLRPGCDDGDDDTTIAQSYQDSDCGRHGATFIVWYSRFGPTDSARHPSWGDLPAGVMRSWNSARALAIWLRQCRLGGAWDACCDRFGRTQRLLRAPTLSHHNCRAFSWGASSAGALWAWAVDDDGCRDDSGARLLLEHRSVVVGLLVLEASTVSEDHLLSLYSCRALSWDVSSAGALWAWAVDDDGCRDDSGARLLMEHRSVVIGLLVLEASTLSEDHLFSIYSCQAFCWVALSAGASDPGVVKSQQSGSRLMLLSMQYSSVVCFVPTEALVVCADEHVSRILHGLTAGATLQLERSGLRSTSHTGVGSLLDLTDLEGCFGARWDTRLTSRVLGAAREPYPSNLCLTYSYLVR